MDIGRSRYVLISSTIYVLSVDLSICLNALWMLPSPCQRLMRREIASLIVSLDTIHFILIPVLIPTMNVSRMVGIVVMILSNSGNDYSPFEYKT